MSSLISLAVAALGATAAAEPASPEVVVVTATRLPTRAADQPVNLTVIDRRQIERSAASGVLELLRGVAGLRVGNIDSLGNGSIDLRGFGVTGAANTQILLDGIRLNDNDLSSPRLGALSLDQIERIEIVRGGSVAHGGGSSGGVINLISRRHSSGAGLKFGSHDSVDGHGHWRGGNEDWRFGLDGRYAETDGERANSAARSRRVAADLGWQGAAVRLSAAASAEREDQRFPGVRRVDRASGLDQFQHDPDGSDSPNDHGRAESWRQALRGEGELGQGRWAVDLSRRHKRIDGFFDYGGGYSSADRRDTDETRLSPRLALPHRWFGVASDLTVGADVGRADSERWDGPLIPSTWKGDSRLDSRAVWFDHGSHLSEATRLTIGARWERAEQRVSLLDWSGVLQQSERTDTLHGFQLGLRQRLDPHWSLYGRIGRSYRLPNSDELADNAELKPQTSRDIEAGLEGRSGAIALRLAVFAMRLDDEIAFQPYVNGFGRNINLAPTRRRGVEFETRWHHEQFELGANLAYTVAEFRSGVYGGIDVADRDVPLVPRWQGNLHAGWQFRSDSRLDLQWHGNGRSRLDNDQANRGPWLAGYGIVDLKLSHRIDRLTLSLSAQNLGDKRYASYGVKGGGERYNLYPAAGRRWWVGADYRF
ncbi:TonB-dependent receptor [Chitinimonas lacunae]|uniref:TonB-dependent receptor n=1 Tax=Chitinimonas lacunae TaxID=1963018 RepID=A0ABV8MRT2_9NEIS